MVHSVYFQLAGRFLPEECIDLSNESVKLTCAMCDVYLISREVERLVSLMSSAEQRKLCIISDLSSCPRQSYAGKYK